MNTKLTLTIDHSIIEGAKTYAKEKGRSLSDLIENYLKAITHEQNKSDIEITPIVKSMKGAFTAPEGFNYREELTKKLAEKYM